MHVGQPPTPLAVQTAKLRGYEIADLRSRALTNEDLEKIRGIEALIGGAFRTLTLDTTYPASEGAAGMAPALERLCTRAAAAVRRQWRAGRP